jgi:hypothetical protein
MKKVKITKVPNMAWGGRVFNQVAPNALPYQTDEDMMRYSNTLQPVSREDANLEAEKDEEVVMPNYKGMSAKFRVGGKRHSEGGTPLNLPDDSFVFSDTRAMKIKDPIILKAFGKAPKKGGYTPAELAKGYDINKYRKILDDPMSDSIQRKTAEEMIGNYNVLLGKLALAQESKKGFPQGIPFIAEPYMMINKVNPEDILPIPEEQGMQGTQAPQQQMPMNKYGGVKKVKIKGLPNLNKANFGNEVDSGWDEITGQAILSANPNEGQIVDVPNSFPSTSWDTGQNNDLTFNSMVDKGFYEKPIEMDLKSERPGINKEVKIKEKNKKKRGYDFFTAQLMKQGLTAMMNASGRNQQDPMLAYRTMEDTMTGVPVGKGTFDPLNKNNFPYKNDYAVYDPFTYSAKYGISLPKGQIGQQIVSNIPGVVPANPLYHPFNDPLTQNIATYKKPKDPSQLPPANNIMIQNALDQQAQAAAVAASLQNQIDQSARSNNAKKNTASQNTSTSSDRGDLISFNQQFWDEYNNLGQSGAFVYDLPGINFQDPKERQRRELQSRIGKDPNIYGDLEWNKGQEWADFTRRHQWYLKDHPDFNPTDNAQVKDFQKEYCKKAASYGMKSCYFIEGAGKGVDIDGKFGEHTWSAPGFNMPEEKPTTKKETKAQEDIKPVSVQQKPPYTPFEYYPQDVLNLMTAIGTQIPDPQTFYSNLAWQGYSPAYIKEDYSPIMEAANIATQGIGAYGSRQSADASYSGIQGKAARQAADHNLQVANLNVGIYNDAEKFNAQTREKNYMYNQMQKQQNFDTEQAYAADRIKAKNEKRANVAALYNQMLTNAVDTYNLNIMNPNFKVLPGTGGMIDIINYDAMKPNKDALTSARVKEYEALIDRGYTHDQAIDILGRQSGKANYSQTQQYPYSNPYDYMTGLNYYEG